MKKFLEFVANDIIKKHGTDLSHIAIVFPNKRASLFINEYLAKTVDHPIWSPAYITISDFFQQHSSLTIGDPIKLVCDIYKSFVECTGINETLDHFFSWGQLLISDFDDIDKNMADASKIFSNVENIHEFDDISYLDDNQKEILKRFFGNFTEENQSELKKRFIQLWCHLEDVYNNFRKRLFEQNMAYEGMLYREVATNGDFGTLYDKYIFVGFNVIQKVEQKIFSTLKEAGKAYFYWDFDYYYMRHKDATFLTNEAGHYISQFIDIFPNELDNSNRDIYDNFGNDKNITYVNASTENIQARYANNWLREGNRYSEGRNTAIVLCDETLLPSVIHYIPEEVDKINITTGYPLFQTTISSFVVLLLDLRLNGYSRKNNTYKAKYVLLVLSHPYAQYVSNSYSSLIQAIKEKKTYNISPKTLSVDGNMTYLFCDIKEEQDLCPWLIGVLRIIANACDKHEKDPLTQEALFRMYTLCNRLNELVKSGDLDVDDTTLQKLIIQLISSTSIPFHGEPAEGVQIMGILETRNLDFDNVLLLSCNEGNMPKGINDSSFIPYSIRKAYGLTTIDNKVAIYAYYFYNLIQRASNVTIAYNNSTENGRAKEASRFMLQLMTESGFDIKRKTLQAGLHPTTRHTHEIPKSKNVMAVLESIDKISPTAINQYMRCPLQFYFNHIAKIKEPEDDGLDEMSNRIFGNVFHLSTEILYTKIRLNDGRITRDAISYALKHKEFIERIVDEAFMQTLFEGKEHDRKFEYNGLQLINREVIIRYLMRLLEIDIELTPFTLSDTELPVSDQLRISTSKGESEITIGGRIDRLDSIFDKSANCEKIRIIDYKTGRDATRKINSIEEIFRMPVEQGKHADYFLQTMLYAKIIRHDSRFNPKNLPVSPALLFIQSTYNDNYDPTLSIGKDKIIDIADYEEEFTSYLKKIISEIFEPGIPFTPTGEKAACTYCPYQYLCNR